MRRDDGLASSQSGETLKVDHRHVAEIGDFKLYRCDKCGIVDAENCHFVRTTCRFVGAQFATKESYGFGIGRFTKESWSKGLHFRRAEHRKTVERKTQADSTEKPTEAKP